MSCLIILLNWQITKYIENFTIKNETFQMKHSGSFHISAQDIDCGYLFEPPRRGGSDEYPRVPVFLAEIRKLIYTPVNPFLL